MENNSFLKSIISIDRELLIYLNNLGVESWDFIWLKITNQLNWIPLFIIVLILIAKKFGIKKTIFTLLFITIFVAFSDQFTNLVKGITGRIRPCNTEDLKEYLRPFSYKPHGYSFWSGHASLSTTFTIFTILLLRKTYKFIYLMLFFPLVFGYSRIYLGVHYPLDVTIGYLSGILLGVSFYKIYKFLYMKIFKIALH